MEQLLRRLRIEQLLDAVSIDITDLHELIDPIENADAMDPTDAKDPMLPTDRTDPVEQMERKEFVERNDHTKVSFVRGGTAPGLVDTRGGWFSGRVCG